MIVDQEQNVPTIAIDNPAVKAAGMKVLIGEKQGWSDYVMRIIELDEGGYSPAHAHPWPHINYMIEGKGVLLMENKEQPVEAGAYAYVPAGTHHQFRNAGADKFRFICIVPKEGHQ